MAMSYSESDLNQAHNIAVHVNVLHVCLRLTLPCLTLYFFVLPVFSLMIESAGSLLLQSDGRHGKPLPSPFAPGGLCIRKPPVRR